MVFRRQGGCKGWGVCGRRGGQWQQAVRLGARVCVQLGVKWCW